MQNARAVGLAQKIFHVSDEPATKSFGGYCGFRPPVLRERLLWCLSHGVSVKAVDRESREIAGIIVNWIKDRCSTTNARYG